MNPHYLIDVFTRESALLDATLRQHPQLAPLFTRRFDGVDRDALKLAYLRLLKIKADYVQYTVPALRGAGLALREGDDVDRWWSAHLLEYAAGETDEHASHGTDYGHHIWAHEDMMALGATAELVNAPTDPAALLYRSYFVDDVARHPYAILGAKGVLEHFSIVVADDVVRGLVASGIANAEQATKFFHHHGVLDVDHVRQGDRNLENLTHPHKVMQILEGAYFTTGSYRALVHSVLPH
jgi:hypothetical protein